MEACEISTEIVLISSFHCNYLTAACQHQPLSRPRDISIKFKCEDMTMSGQVSNVKNQNN